MPTSLDHISRGLRLLRKERKLSQAELAEAAGVSTKLVSAIEQGERSPSLETVDKLCRALSVTPIELLQAGAPPGLSGSRSIRDRAASMFNGLDEASSQRILEVMWSVRELLDVDRTPRPRPRRRYAKTPKK